MHLLCRGSGYPVLFIHGMPTSNQLWRGVIERLCGHFTCLAIDLPGLGNTPSEPYSSNYLEMLANRIEALRIEKKIEKWHVVGHDAGSAVAVRYALTFQERVGQLALLSPALFPELKPYFLLELLRKPIIGELLAPPVSSIFWNIAMRRATRNEEEIIVDPVFNSFRRPFLGVEGSWRFMRVMRWGKPAEVLGDIPACLPHLLVPTVIFWGLRDPAIPQAFARRALTLIPNSTLVEVDSGHFIPLNRPAFVASKLLHFFARTTSESFV